MAAEFEMASSNSVRDWSGLAKSVGFEVRRLRDGKGLKANKLAALAGISVGMLSKIENGSSAPSFATLIALSETLGVPVSRFFIGQDSGGDCSVVRAGHGVIVERQGSRSGQRYELLGHLLSGKLFVEPYLVTLEADTLTAPTFQHTGVEFLYILEGAMMYRYADQLIEVGVGDSLLFDCTARHGAESLLTPPVRFLSAVFTERDFFP